jgi:4-azaleucine resistance transporter AzlC
VFGLAARTPARGAVARLGHVTGRSAERSPVTAGILLGFAVGLYGISFGLIAVTGGLSVAQACAMSLLVFTGASQFAAVGVVASGGSPLAAIGSALLLGARNGVYGLAMSRVLKDRGLKRLIAAQLVIDESTALSLGQSDENDQRRAFWAAGLAVFAFWNLGTLLGALGGDVIGQPETWGLDAMFPAGFVSLLVPHLRKPGGKQAALFGAFAVLVTTPVLPKGLPILVAALGALVGLRTRPAVAP